MKFSIIIPVYNDPHITDCLKSIAQLDYSRDEYEVIIIDNNCNPEFSKTLQADQVKFNFIYIQELQPGSYIARNAGLQITQGDYLAFTDSDCVVDTQWLKVIEEIFNSNEVDGVMGFAKGNNRNTIAKYEQMMYEANINQFVNESRLARIDTRNFAIKRKVYETIHGFSEKLKYGGDMEYGARAHAAGLNIIFSKKVIVHHTNPIGLYKLLQKRMRQNYGNMLIRNLHPKKFIEHYFPHLKRYENTPNLKWQWYVLRILGFLTFWWSGAACRILPSKLGYWYFKFVNVVAMRLGQISYYISHE